MSQPAICVDIFQSIANILNRLSVQEFSPGSTLPQSPTFDNPIQPTDDFSSLLGWIVFAGLLFFLVFGVRAPERTPAEEKQDA